MDYGPADGGPSRSATLYGPGDVDWFKYHVDDVFGGFAYPRVQLTIPANYNFDLCLYIRCSDFDSSDVISCPAGTAADNSSVPGYKGCCSQKTGNLSEDVYLDSNGEFGCDSSDDDYDALVLVRNAGANWTCSASYTLVFGDA